MLLYDVLANKGDIDAVFSYIHSQSMFGPLFTFSPSQGIVRPGGYKVSRFVLEQEELVDMFPLEHCTRITVSCLIHLRGSNCTFCTSVVACKADVRNNTVKYLPVHEQANIITGTQKFGNEVFLQSSTKSVKKLQERKLSIVSSR